MGVTCLSKVWPACKAMGHTELSEPRGWGDLPATPAWSQGPLHSSVSVLDPTAILRDIGCLGPSFTSSGTGWGSGPHVWVAFEQDSWRPRPRQFQIGRIQPCVLVPTNPAKKDTVRTNYPECGLGSWWWYLPLPTQSLPPPPCPPLELQSPTSQKQAQLTANPVSHLPYCSGFFVLLNNVY